MNRSPRLRFLSVSSLFALTLACGAGCSAPIGGEGESPPTPETPAAGVTANATSNSASSATTPGTPTNPVAPAARATFWDEAAYDAVMNPPPLDPDKPALSATEIAEMVRTNPASGPTRRLAAYTPEEIDRFMNGSMRSSMTPASPIHSYEDLVNNDELREQDIPGFPSDPVSLALTLMNPSLGSIFTRIGISLTDPKVQAQLTEFAGLVRKMLVATTYGVGAGLGAALSGTVVNKAVGLETVLLPTTEGGEMSAGFFCTTGFGVNLPEVSLTVSLYGIKAIGMKSQGDYGRRPNGPSSGDGIQASFGMGVPLEFGSLGGAGAINVGIEGAELVKGLLEHPELLSSVTLLAEAPALAVFFTQWATDQVNNAQNLLAGLVAGAIVQNAIRNPPVRPAKDRGNIGGGAPNAALNTALTAVNNNMRKLVTAINGLNQDGFIGPAIDRIVAALPDTVPNTKNLLKLIKKTVPGGMSVTLGVAADIGLGVKEDTPVPVAAGAAIVNEQFLFDLRPSAFIAARTAINGYLRNATDAATALSRAQSDLATATSLVEPIQAAYDNAVACVNTWLYAWPNGSRVPDWMIRNGYTNLPAVGICFGQENVGWAVSQFTNGNMLARLNALRQGVDNANAAVTAAIAGQGNAVRAAVGIADGVRGEVTRNLRDFAIGAAGCAGGALVAPFAATAFREGSEVIGHLQGDDRH